LPNYLLRGSGAANADSVPIRDLIEILCRGWKLVLVLSAILASTLGAWILITPTSYESEMTFLVKNDRADVVVTSGQTVGLSGRQWIDESQVNTEIQLLQSKELLRRVVETCRLAWTRGSSRKPTSIEVERAIRDLERSIVVTPILKANMLKVSYTAGDPQEASTVLRTLADAYLDRNLKVHSTTGTYEFFHGQASLYEDRLKKAQARLVEFQTPRNIVLLGQQKDLILRKLVDLQASLGESEAVREESLKRLETLQTQIGAASTRIQTQSRELSNQYSVEHLTTMVTDLENKRTELATKFQPNDRTIRQIDDQIANTRATLQRERERVVTEDASDLNPLRQGLEAERAKTQSGESGLRGRIAVLSGQVKSYQHQLAELEKSTAKYDELVRTAKESEENYLLYSRKQEEARIADALDRQKIGNVALLDPPRTPSLPQRKITKSTVVALFLGVLLILGIAISAATLRNTVYTSAELEALTDLPVLASVPYHKHLLSEAPIVIS
jgi:uncharacterized protein involved in exopolysaccharide biosynthesis